MKKIPLGRSGKFAIVDDEDFEYLSQWSWYLSNNYAVRFYDGSKRMPMHRMIMKTPDGMVTDHINGNGIDNRRANLRICTQIENSYNHSMNKNNTSGYKGVHWFKRAKRWQAYINCENKRIHLGYFSTAKDAAMAYDKAAVEYHGDFAKTNFKQSGNSAS